MATTLHFPTLLYQDLHLGLIIGTCRHILQLSEREQTFAQDLSKDHMLVIQPVSLGQCEVELAAIRIWPRVGLQTAKLSQLPGDCSPHTAGVSDEDQLCHADATALLCREAH